MYGLVTNLLLLLYIFWFYLQQYTKPIKKTKLEQTPQESVLSSVPWKQLDSILHGTVMKPLLCSQHLIKTQITHNA